MLHLEIKKKKKKTRGLPITRAFPSETHLRASLRQNDVHVENIWPKCYNISSVLSIFKHNPGKTNNKFIITS